MRALDWIVFALFLGYVIYDGVRRTRGSKDLDAYYAGSRQIPWWAAGLSIMATQASAITVIGTTGDGHEYGMQFLHQYLGLPIAMVVLCVFFIPLLRQSPILTAYEFFETRFGPSTRSLASLVFLVSRCTALGLVIVAPAVVLSAMTGWDVTTTTIVIGVLTTGYTVLGGMNAVVWTDVKQMSVILVGLVVTFVILLVELLGSMSFGDVLSVAGAAGRLNAFEVVPDPEAGFWADKDNIWSGFFGGTFLMLAYFGCDQSQAQRLLTSPSANDSRKALLLSAFAKLPMQAGVLAIGVLLWVFHVLNGAPLYFHSGHAEEAAAKDPVVLGQVEARYEAAAAERRARMLELTARPRGADGQFEPTALEAYRDSVREVQSVRREAFALVSESKDTNHIFPHFILNQLPILLVGLLVAAIFAAAMSSVDSVLNSLSAATVVDFYRRWLRPKSTDAQQLVVARASTLVWGAFATIVAVWLSGGDSIIRKVNKVGSFFYGTLLGGFLLALLVRRAGERAATCGLVAGMATVLTIHATLIVHHLWYNLFGAAAVVLVGFGVSLTQSAPTRTTNSG